MSAENDRRLGVVLAGGVLPEDGTRERHVAILDLGLTGLAEERAEEVRVRLLRRLGTGTVVVLVFEPVDLDQGEMAVRLISSRRAEPHEARDDWRVCGG